MATTQDPIFAEYKRSAARLDVAFFQRTRAEYLSDTERTAAAELFADAVVAEYGRKSDSAIRAAYRCLTDRHFGRLAALSHDPVWGPILAQIQAVNVGLELASMAVETTCIELESVERHVIDAIERIAA